MIKVAIDSAASADAGELLRILIHHPDVEVTSLTDTDAAASGQRADSVHRGLVGDTDLTLQKPGAEPPQVDALFLCGVPSWTPEAWPAEMRVIDLTGRYADGSWGFVNGLGELNRKAMVRGATRATVPAPGVHAAALALLPLAKNLLLNDIITVSANCDPAALAALLAELQTSFNSANIIIAPVSELADRTARAVVTTDCNVSPDHLRQLYEEFYDDHNFTFIIDRQPLAADVVNTNKCLLQLAHQGKTLQITALIDGRVKGCAGTAVHCMNLLFGLHERTGLDLKALA